MVRVLSLILVISFFLLSNVAFTKEKAEPRIISDKAVVAYSFGKFGGLSGRRIYITFYLEPSGQNGDTEKEAYRTFVIKQGDRGKKIEAIDFSDSSDGAFSINLKFKYLQKFNQSRAGKEGVSYSKVTDATEAYKMLTLNEEGGVIKRNKITLETFDIFKSNIIPTSFDAAEHRRITGMQVEMDRLKKENEDLRKDLNRLLERYTQIPGVVPDVCRK